MKNEHNDENSEKAKKSGKITEVFRGLIFAYKIVWKASPKFFMAKLFITIIQAVLPYAELYMWRQILNRLSITDIQKSLSTENIGITLGLAAAGYCTCLLLSKITDQFNDFIEYKYKDECEYFVENMMIDKVSTMDLGYFDSSKANDLIDRSYNYISSIKSSVFMVFDIPKKIFQIIASGILLITLGPAAALVIAAVSIPQALSNIYIHVKHHELFEKSSDYYRRADYFSQRFDKENIMDIRLYSSSKSPDSLSELFIGKYKELMFEHHNQEFNIKQKGNMVDFLSNLIYAAGEVFLYSICIAKLISGTFGVGDVSYFVSLGTRFKSDLAQFASTSANLSNRLKELNGVHDFMNLKPLIEKSGTLIPSPMPEIEFRHVKFTYPGKDSPVLTDCSFKIEKGKTVGLVGLNGSGKSTIVNLLLRFYNPDEGEILIDGVNAQEYDIVKLREVFGVCFQDYIRYSFTVRENIALSDISRKNDDESVISACEFSRADDFVKKFEKGIDETLTRRYDDGGQELSGGQWQRIALARAFFRKSDIMILDEPSAALDPEAEHEIFSKYSAMTHQKSTLLISHRLSSITIADKIIVLENGSVAEEGSHSELVSKKDGIYAHLFELQAQKYYT